MKNTTDKPLGETEPLVFPPNSAPAMLISDASIWGLAADKDRVYLSAPWRNKIKVYKAADFSPVPEMDISVHRPRGLALDGSGNILVVSDGKVLSIPLQTDLRAHATHVLIDDELSAPFAIARNPVNGDLFVTELGETQQIKKFSSDGKLLNTFGRLGGGTDYRGGKFESASFRRPCGISVDPDGKSFWVAEDYIPKRCARYSTDNGTVLYEGFGSVGFGSYTAPNPLDPSEVFTTMLDVMSGRVDPYYGKKFDNLGRTVSNWKMDRVLLKKWGNDKYSSHFKLGAPGAAVFIKKVLSREGKLYIWTGQGLYLVEGDRLRSVFWFRGSLIYNLKDARQGGIDDVAGNLILSAFAKQKWPTDRKDLYNGVPDRSYLGVTTWQDIDGNMEVTEDEIIFGLLPDVRRRPGNYLPLNPHPFADPEILDDFTIVGLGYFWTPTFKNGVPLYDPAKIIPQPGYSPNDTPLFRFLSQDVAGGFRAPPVVVADDAYYYFINAGTSAGGDWPTQCTKNYVVSLTRDFRPRWRIGQHSSYPPNVAKAGEMYYLSGGNKLPGDCILANDRTGWLHVIHKDGFYVQSLLDNPFPKEGRAKRAILLESDIYNSSVFVHPDIYNSSVSVHPTTKKVYFYVSSTQAVLIYEILNLGSVTVLPANKFTL